MSMFAPATRQQVPLKIGITGPSGSGKTTAALRIARGLVGPGGKIAVVDTENGSASLYADETPFSVVNMSAPYQVVKFLRAIEDATAAGFNALIIDSGSAEWTELLAEKEAMDARGGNGFANWGAITKKHEDFLKAVRNAPIHLILCLRAKQEHVQDKDDKGKTTIRKVGMAAVQRDGMEYELTTVFDIAMDHNYKVSKDRTRLFDGRMEQISVATGQELATWLQSGAPLAENPTPPPVEPLPQTAAPTPAPAPAKPVQQAPARPTPARPTGTPSSQSSPAAPVQTAPSEVPGYPQPWIDAMATLAEVSMGMPEKTRAALVAGFEADGPDALPALLAEIASIRSVMGQPEPKTVGAALLQMPPTPKPAVSQEASDFVEGMADGPMGAATPAPPDTDEANGGISPEQYAALNMMIGTYKIDREKLRAYAINSDNLLPCAGGRPTLARFKASGFVKLRDRLNNKKIASDNETWSARTVRIINATPTSFSPLSAVS